MRLLTTYQETEMDKKLVNAIKTIHKPDEWVHFSSIGPDGGPHVTPLMMGIHEQGCYSALPVNKKREILREIREHVFQFASQ